MRTWPHSKAQPTGFGVTTQLRHLVLPQISLRRKRHESVMNLVMVYGVLTSSAGNGHTIVERFNCTAAFAAPCPSAIYVGIRQKTEQKKMSYERLETRK
jgi:hypothetical protein